MAQDVIGTRLEITGEATYRAKLSQAAQALRNVASQDKVLQAQYDKSDRSLAKLTQSLGLMQSKLDVQKQKLAAVKEEYDRVVASQGDNSDQAQKLAVTYNNASAEVQTTARELKALEKEIKDGTDATKDNTQQILTSAEALKKHETRVKANKEAVQSLGHAMETMGARVAKAAAAMTAAIITLSVKGFLEFGDQMGIVSTIADETAMSLEEMAAETLDASDNIGTAATELAQAEYQAISSGVGTADSVKFVETAAKAAKAGLSDTTTMVKASTAIINAWGKEWGDATDVMDKLIVTQNIGVTTAGELASSIGDLTGLAPQLNISLEDILAATAALTKNGYSTSASMTALKGVMAAVLKPSAEASKMAEKLGLDFSSAALQSKGFAAFLADVLEKTDGNADSLAMLFGQVEGLAGVMALAGSASDDFASSLTALSSSAGAMEATFDKRMSSPAQRFSLALNRMQNSAIRFGQTLSPYIDMAAGSIEKLADAIGNMSASQQMELLQVAGWTIGIAGMVSVAGKLITSFKAIASVAGLLFSTPTGWVILGIAAIAALGVALYKASKQGDGLDQAWAKIRGQTSEERIAELSAKIDVNATVEGFEDAKARVDELKQWLSGLQTQGLLSAGEVSNISAALEGSYRPIVSALIAVGVPPDVAQQVADQIDGARADVRDVLLAINPAISDAEVEQITSLIGKPMDEVAAALVDFGFTPGSADYNQLYSAIETANTAVNTAFSGIDGVSPEIIAGIQAACGDDHEALYAALKSLGLSDADANRLATELSSTTRVIDSAIQGVYDDVIATLTDGLPDDPGTVAKLKDDVHQKFQTLVDAVEEQANKDIAALDPTDPDYDTKVSDILTDAAAVKAALASFEQDYYSFIDTYAGKSADTVREHAAELMKLTGDVDAVLAYIRQAENEVLSAGSGAFNLVAGGKTLDEDTISKGFNFAIARQNSGTANVDEQYTKDVADLQARLARGQISDKMYAVEEGALRTKRDADKQAIIAEYQQNLRDLFDGLAKASGNAEWGDAVVGNLEARDVIEGIKDKFAAGTLTAEDLGADEVRAAFEKAFGEGFDPLSILAPGMNTQQDIADAYNTLNQNAEDALKNIEAPPILQEWFDTLFDSGAFDGMDTTETEDQVKIMAGNVGSAAVDGYAAGIADNASKAGDAASALGLDSIGRLKNSLQVRSPSKETASIGGFFVDGIVNGIVARQGRAFTAVANMARQMLVTMKRELGIASPSKEMFRLGEFSADGYINAINHKVRDVRAATTRMASLDGVASQQTGSMAVRGAAQAADNRPLIVQWNAPYSRAEAMKFGKTMAQGMRFDSMLRGG